MLANGEQVNVKRTLISSKEDNVNKRSLNVNEYNKARHLVDKFEKIGCNDADGCFNFFVKCFKNLSEYTIWNIYEKATNDPAIKSPIKYFIAGCRNQMR